jgi:hypothetical protein
MRVLFLDIDGVLNSTRTCVAFGGYPMELEHLGAFDHVAIRLLQRMCDSAGVQIVLSSAWRLFHDHKEVASALGLPIIDRTPSMPGPRGGEIADWLSRHPEVEEYAIVDDDPDMLPEQLPRFVKTSGEEGLSFGDYRKLCSLLGANPYEGEPRDRNWRGGGVKLAWE